MKPTTLVLLAGVAVGAAGLVITNPSPAAYEQYASQQARQYLRQELCTELPDTWGPLMQERCQALVQQVQPQVQRLVRDRTQRLNLGIASLYHTSLGIPGLPMLPRYEVKTVGIMGRFITYQASQEP